MKKILLITLSIVSITVSAQRYKTTESNVKFYSSAPVEDIEAVNTNVTSIIDTETKAVVFVVPMTSFEFEKSLMQEHFNENYLESEKYPKAIFKGKIIDWNGEMGESKATVEGELDLHGIKKNVSMEGTIDYQTDKMEVNSVFMIKLEDYKIKIPKAVFYNIAEEVEVTVKFEYASYEKN
ncbi:MAG: YceI family protein [Ekhidna sp.]